MKRGYVLRFPFFVANSLKIGNLLKTYLEKILWVNENKLKKLFFIPILLRRFTSSNNKTLLKNEKFNQINRNFSRKSS